MSETLPELITVTCEKAANGGTFVARHERRVVFVRYAAPGETVVARVLDPDPHASFWRAECIDVLEESPDRVPSVWPESGVDGIGGADYAHIALPAQRRIKTEVLRELLSRAHVKDPVAHEIEVEPAPGDFDGLRKRTRAYFAVDRGRAGMRGWRSHEVFDVGENPLVTLGVHDLGVGAATLPQPVQRVDVAAPADGSRPLVTVAAPDADASLASSLPSFGDASVILETKKGPVRVTGEDVVHEQVGEFSFTVAGNGFWQVHRDAPAVLSETVLSGAAAEDGMTVWDLYAGAGLYARPLAAAVGRRGRIFAVEGSRRAVADADRNLAGLAGVTTAESDVTAWVRAQAASGQRPEVVVLDPPRAGAGLELMDLLCSVVGERIVYVSCDPATLARDLARAGMRGWHTVDMRAFDLFPHTHHLECVVLLERA